MRSWRTLPWRNIVLAVVVVVVVNGPSVASLVQRHRVAAGGVEVRAQLQQHRVVDGVGLLSFAVPEDSPEVGDAAFEGTARVDRRTYAVSSESGVVDVRVLPGSTTAWRVDGEVGRHSDLPFVLLLDVALLLIALAYVRYRGRLRPALVLRAEADLEATDDEPTLDRLNGQRYVVCGVVRQVRPDAVTIEVVDRTVQVLLAGRHNPVGPADLVRVVGEMVG